MTAIKKLEDELATTKRELTFVRVARAHIAAQDAEIARLREAGEALLLVVGLTAFKYEMQRAILQEASDGMRAALVKTPKGAA